MAKASGGTRSIKPKSVPERAKETIGKVISDIKQRGFSMISPFKIGGVEKRMSDFAAKNGIELGSKDIYMSSSAIAHATRESKQAKKLSVSDKDLKMFPIKRRKMDLYYDSITKNFTYTDNNTKYILHPNYKIKMPNGRNRLVNFITASKTDGKEFNQKNYEKIK